jgi:protein TonB
MNILDYIRGNRRGREAHRLERDAMSDPLLADALEGYDAVEGRHEEAIARLRDRIAVRAQGRRSHRRVWLVAAAAGVALLLGVGGLYRFWIPPQEELEVMYDTRPIVEEEMIEIASSPQAADTALRIAQAGDETLRESPPELRAETAAPELERQKLQVVADTINIVNDDQKIDTELTFLDFDDNTEVFFSPDSGEVEMMAFAPTRSGSVEGTVMEDAPFMIVSDMPKFLDGDITKFRDWVQARIAYPPVAQENGIQGRVTLQFVIERDGTLTDIKVINSPDRSLAEEAVRIVKSSPKWQPGSEHGVPARVSYTLPVDFRLQ